MNRIRRRIGENKINRLILAFLKAGHMCELQFNRTEAGTPPRWHRFAAARQYRFRYHRRAVHSACLAPPESRWYCFY
jgi:hypothetical protein